MATERLQIVIDAVFKGKRGIEQAGRELKEFDDQARKASEGTRYLAGQAAKGFAMVGGAVAAAALAAREAYQIIGEGAELQKAAEQFDNLTNSIGVTSEAMLGSLKAATSGMMSDAELMSSASQIISLGLADTQENVTRLATVIGALGLPMNDVILTMANDSRMRLDQLGLSVEDVNEKMAQLQAEGFAGDAFDEAVLIALEEKMVLLGDASQTTAGQMAIFEASVKNFSDEMKIMAADLAVSTGALDTFTTKVQESLNKTQFVVSGLTSDSGKLAIAGDALNAMWMAGPGLLFKYNQVVVDGALKLLGYEEAVQGVDAALDSNTAAVTQNRNIIDRARLAHEEYSDAADMYATQARENTTLTEHEAAKFAYLSEQAGILRDELMEATYGHEEFADAAMMYASQAETNSTLTEQQANHFRYLAEQSELAAEKILLLEEAEAGYFVEAINATDQTFNLNQEMFNAAEQAGASAEELAILGGGLGLYSEEAVDAALKTAAVRIKIQELAEEYAAGNITLGEYRTQVQLFINDLEGIPSERTISFKLDIPPIPSELSGQPTGVKQTQQGPAVFGASGLDFTVPPGFPNDSFGPIFVQSGEHVKVTPAGETSSKGGGNTINVYAYPGMSANAIASAVNQQLVVGG